MKKATEPPAHSFLEALGARVQEHEVGGVKGTFHELTTEQVAILLEKVGSLIAVIYLIKDLLVVGAAGYQEVFSDATVKLSIEGRNVLYQLIAFSLNENEEAVKRIAPRNLPELLVAIYETNKGFFDSFSETSALRAKLRAKFPGLEKALAGLTTAGSDSSPVPDAEDGASEKSE